MFIISLFSKAKFGFKNIDCFLMMLGATYQVKVNPNADLRGIMLGLVSMTIGSALVSMVRFYNTSFMGDEPSDENLIGWNTLMKNMPRKVLCLCSDSYVFSEIQKHFDNMVKHGCPFKTASVINFETMLHNTFNVFSAHDIILKEHRETQFSFLRSIRELKHKCGLPHSTDDIIISQVPPDDRPVMNLVDANKLVLELSQVRNELEKKIKELTDLCELAHQRLDKRRRHVRNVLKKRPAQPSRPSRKTTSSTSSSSSSSTKRTRRKTSTRRH